MAMSFSSKQTFCLHRHNGHILWQSKSNFNVAPKMSSYSFLLIIKYHLISSSSLSTSSKAVDPSSWTRFCIIMLHVPVVSQLFENRGRVWFSNWELKRLCPICDYDRTTIWESALFSQNVACPIFTKEGRVLSMKRQMIITVIQNRFQK